MPIIHSSNPLNWSFRRFWSFCAEELGSARLQVNTAAKTLDEFCGNSQFAMSVLKDVLRASYKRSRCNNLDSAINLDATLDVLGETAYLLHGEQQGDLLDIELLEEVGWCVNAIYSRGLAVRNEATTRPVHAGQVCSDTNPKPNNANSPKTARVVSLKRRKLRKANAQY